MATVRAPGVYFEPSEQRVPPLELGRTGVPVFIGITRRGPLDRPIRVTSVSRFFEVFGESVPGTYLASAIRGFFDNGGESCFVLRVARVDGVAGEDLARSSWVELADGKGAPTLRIEAQDPGLWGNGLRVTVTRSDEIRTFLTRDAEKGEDRLQVKSTHGLAPGAWVRVHTPELSHWTSLTRIDGKTVSLAHPLPAAFASARPTYLSAHGFDLQAFDLERRERFERLSLLGLSPRYVERVINEQSRLIRATVLRPGTEDVAASIPVPATAAPLGGGGDGVAHLGPEDFIGHDRGPGNRRGIEGLVEYSELDLVCAPDLMAAYEQSKRFKSLRDVEVVQDAMIRLCERASPSRFALLDLPPGLDFEDALRWRRQYDSAHAALYFPWLVVLDPGRRSVPPCGHVAGIVSRSDKQHGVHKAPANEQVEGIVDLSVLLQDPHLARLNEASINCIRTFGPRGIRLWGARTLSSDSEWRYLNVRRTVSAIAWAIELGTQWAVFEPNGPLLWKRVSRIVAGFLMGLRERGMLSGETPEEAFFVQCNAETNPPEDVDRGMLSTRIGLAVTRPVEYIVFRLSQRLEDQARSDEE